MGPGGVQNELKMEANSMNHLKWPPDHFQNAKVPTHSSIFHDFWVPSGAQKSTKKSIVGENWGPGATIFSIFAGKGAATYFFIDFSSIFDWKIDVFFVAFFETSLHFFGHGDPHDLSIFIGRNTLFHFLIFHFLEKKCFKIQAQKCI